MAAASQLDGMGQNADVLIVIAVGHFRDERGSGRSAPRRGLSSLRQGPLTILLFLPAGAMFVIAAACGQVTRAIGQTNCESIYSLSLRPLLNGVKLTHHA